MSATVPKRRRVSQGKRGEDDDRGADEGQTLPGRRSDAAPSGISGEGRSIPVHARVGSMKTTIDIPDEELEAVMRNTGAATKREAVVTAISEFNRRKEIQELIAQFGTFESFMTQEDLRRMREEP